MRAIAITFAFAFCVVSLSMMAAGVFASIHTYGWGICLAFLSLYFTLMAGYLLTMWRATK